MNDILKMIDEIHASVPAEEWDKVPDSNGWLPIKTAPSDGRQIIIFGPRGVEVTSADGDWWRFTRDMKFLPTHWQPLPKPPGQK